MSVSDAEETVRKEEDGKMTAGFGEKAINDFRGIGFIRVVVKEARIKGVKKSESLVRKQKH